MEKFILGSQNTRGGVEDTRLEAKAKDKKLRGQRQPFRGQTLSRPRTGMLEAKDTGVSVLRKTEKKGLQNNFSDDLIKTGFLNNFSSDFRKKKVFKIFFRRSPKEKNKKAFANFPQGFWRFPTKF